MDAPLFIVSLLCLLTAIVLLSRHLPAQNIAFIVVFLAIVEIVSQTRNVLFWPGAIILLRLAAQRLLRRWRQKPNYGYFLLGVTSGGAAALQLVFGSLEQAAVRFCVTALCLLCLTPWFVQKRVTTSEAPKEPSSGERSTADTSRSESGS